MAGRQQASFLPVRHVTCKCPAGRVLTVAVWGKDMPGKQTGAGGDIAAPGTGRNGTRPGGGRPRGATAPERGWGIEEHR